ncbi:putative ubiquitin thioesterase otu1 [Zancudomyces culisetae]|uniref:Putative ubiquitin thioesterase otu1 n=1 Tax=Zancudomyces culisetae TaxID=1213189 RepID=A0A1R1PYH4_ZANCU|nr:putative ubiquitin thioesterase otu1 [Zancudomyces culisetae]|eukprot:OMH86006.1 putative ubiquitin thioesterase otu1 [Zancudomyces culisetae]
MSSAKLIRKQGSSVVGANISGFGVTSNTMALAQQKTVFDITGIDRVHQLVAELAKLIQNDFGYTDTAGFKIRCSICNKILYGEKDANAHMKESGHHQFEEIK